MSERSRGTRQVVAGVVTGALVTLAMGRAAAPDRRQSPPVQRYQITGMRDDVGNDYLYILDHQTQKVYRRPTHGIQGNSPTVEQLIQG